MNDRMRNKIKQDILQIAPQVWTEATGGKKENQSKFRQKVLEICEETERRHYSSSEIGRALVWKKLYQTIWYAGIRARTATAHIDRTWEFFSDFDALIGPEWDVYIEKGKPAVGCGSSVVDYFSHSGEFSRMKPMKNGVKLKKVISAARHMSCFYRQFPNASGWDWVASLGPLTSPKKIQSSLFDVLCGRPDLTTMHFMMDVGVPGVLKPDIIVSKIACKFNWWRGDDVDLNLALRKYDHPHFYWPLCKKIFDAVSTIRIGEMEETLGWSHPNLLRLVDLILVKAGQYPEPEFGIETTILKWEGDTPETSDHEDDTPETSDHEDE